MSLRLPTYKQGLLSKKNMKLFYLPLLVFFSMLTPLFGQDTILLSKTSSTFPIGNKVSIFIDSSNRYTTNTPPAESLFKQSTTKVPAYLMPKNNIWLRFVVRNTTRDSDFFFNIQYANIPELRFFKKDSSGSLILQSLTGNQYLYSSRNVDDANFTFKLHVAPNAVHEYYLHIKSPHPVQLPMFVETLEQYDKASVKETLIIGLYAGIIIAIFFYNLFLFFSTKDTSYLMYVVYLFCLLFAQLTFSGWTFKYLWPNSPSFNQYAVIFTSALPGITGLIFSLKFLHVKRYSAIISYIYTAVTVLYSFVGIFCFVMPHSTGYALLTYGGIAGGLLLIISSGYIAYKGYRPAYYYFIAWFLFALGRQVL